MRINIQLLPIAPDPGYLSTRSVVVLDILQGDLCNRSWLSAEGERVYPCPFCRGCLSQEERISAWNDLLRRGEGYPAHRGI